MEQEIKKQITLHPVETKRASEEIFEQIRGMIVQGEIAPGERLPSERKMMDMLKRSRPTIREAMRMLEREGYVKIIPGSNGAVVQEISLDNVVQSLDTVLQYNRVSLENILEFRRINETSAVRLAAERRTKEDLDALGQVLAEAEEQMDDIQRFIACDVKFHSLIATAARNEVFGIMFQVCRNVIGDSIEEAVSAQDMVGQRKMKEEIMQMHRNVLECIQKKEPQKAEEAMLYHLQRAEEDLKK